MSDERILLFVFYMAKHGYDLWCGIYLRKIINFQKHLGVIKLVVTLVNIAQGMAEARLTSQMRRIILLAFPMEEREREESGRHIARYLAQEYKSLS